MIEFVPPRADAFGDAAPADFVGVDTDVAFDDDEPPRSPWLTGLAALGVAGLLSVGVIAAAPWQDGDAAPSATTAPPITTAPPVTMAPPVTTALAGDDDPLLTSSLEQAPGWLPIGDGAGFTVAGATSSLGSARDGDAFAFWTTDGATRTSGRWLAIDEIPSGHLELRRDATVIDVQRADGTWPAVLTVSDDGVAELSVARAARAPWFSLTGFGWSLDELLVLASGVEVEPGSIGYPDSWAVGGGPLDGLVEVHHGTSDWDPGATIAGRARAFTFLAHARTGVNAAVVVSAVATPALFISQFLVRVPIDDASLRRAERARLGDLARDGRRVSLFRVARDPSVIGAAWYDGGGNEVMVVSNGRTAELLDLIASLRPATAQEWADAVDDERTPVGRRDRPIEIGGGVGEGWSMQVSSNAMWINAGDGWMSAGWPPAEGRTAVRYASVNGAYVVVVDTTLGDADGRLPASAVVLQGDERQEIALVTLDDGTRAAAVRVDPRLPFTVAWLAADGVVLGGGP